MQGNCRIYLYSRGDKYSCQAMVLNGDHVIFSNINVPTGTPENVVAKMLDDAEEEALKEYQREIETKYSGT